MAISSELRKKILDYENQGYSPNEIISGIESSENFPDIATKVKAYKSQGYTVTDILKEFHEADVIPTERTGVFGQFQRIGDIYSEEERKGREAVGKFIEKPTGKSGLGAILGLGQWALSPMTAASKGAFGEPVEKLAETVGIPQEVDVSGVSKILGPVPARKLLGELAEQVPYILPYGAAVKQAIKAPELALKTITGKEAQTVAKQLSEHPISPTPATKPPLKYVTEPSSGLAEELTAAGKLSKPVIQETIQKQVVDAAEITLKTLPLDEKKRIGQQIIELVHSGGIDWKALPDILKKYNITAEEFAQRLKDTYSTAGRTLQRLSLVARNVRKELAKNPEAQKFLDTFIKELPEPVGWDKFMSSVFKVESTRRALLVTQLATSMRNIASQGTRATIGSIDDAFQGLIRGTVGGEGNTLRQIGEGLDTFTAFFHRLTPSGRKIFENIKSSDNAAVWMSKLFTTPIQEAVGGKIANAFNVLNRGQEYFFRKMAFEAKLTQLLERKGINIREIDPRKISQGMLEEATNYALEMTFAAMPKSTWGKKFVQAWSSQPIATALINPFPRFAFGNALPYIWNFSPVSLLKMMNPKVVAELASGNPERFAQTASKATLGIMQLAMGLHLRNSKHRGENWYEVKVGDSVYDTRSYAPLLSPYLLVAEAMSHPDRLKPVDWTSAIMGLNRIAGTGLVLVDVLRTGGMENAAKIASRLAGAYLGSFSVPARTFQDVYGAFRPEAALIRDVRESPITGPFTRNVPGLSEILPFAYSPMKKELPKVEAPLLRQLTGISKRTKTLLEKEVDELQLSYKTLYHLTGIPKADRVLTSYMGPELERIAPRLINNPRYINMEPQAKKLLLESVFREAKKGARARLAREEPDLYRKIKWEGIDVDIRDLLKERGIVPPWMATQRIETSTIKPPTDFARELSQARIAISQGIPVDKVKEMYKVRTGQEYPE